MGRLLKFGRKLHGEYGESEADLAHIGDPAAIADPDYNVFL